MWHSRRALANLMHDYDDYDLEYKEEFRTDEKTAEQVLLFFRNGSELIQPAKSFFVAIVYAALMEAYFSIPFYEALSMPDLLTEDKWFRPYDKAKGIYDRILLVLPHDFLSLPSVQKTKAYFKEEFLIGADSESNQAL